VHAVVLLLIIRRRWWLLLLAVIGRGLVVRILVREATTVLILRHGVTQVGGRRVCRHHGLIVGTSERPTWWRRAIAATRIHVILMDSHGVAGGSRRSEQRGVVLRWQHARVRRIRDAAVVAEARGRSRCGRVRRIRRIQQIQVPQIVRRRVCPGVRRCRRRRR